MSYLQTIPSDVTNLIRQFVAPSVVYHLVFEDSVNYDPPVSKSLGIYLSLELAVITLLEHLYTWKGEDRNYYNVETK